VFLSLTDVSEFINLMVLFVESLGSAPLVNSRWHDGLLKSPREIRMRGSLQVRCLGPDDVCTNVGRYWMLLTVSRIFVRQEVLGIGHVAFLK
jgi:hypothetical protein